VFLFKLFLTCSDFLLRKSLVLLIAPLVLLLQIHRSDLQICFVIYPSIRVKYADYASKSFYQGSHKGHRNYCVGSQTPQQKGHAATKRNGRTNKEVTLVKES